MEPMSTVMILSVSNSQSQTSIQPAAPHLVTLSSLAGTAYLLALIKDCSIYLKSRLAGLSCQRKPTSVGRHRSVVNCDSLSRVVEPRIESHVFRDLYGQPPSKSASGEVV
jgi:hypothetical protein